MLTLFVVSTKSSWTSIAYTSWFGCENFIQHPYHPQAGVITEETVRYLKASGGSSGANLTDNPSQIQTMAGDFVSYKCDVNAPDPMAVMIFYPFFIVLTSWVVISLFISVISMVCLGP